jgi:AcrR family transcriptional regulator
MSARNKKRLELIKKEKRDLYLLMAGKIFQQKGFHGTAVKDITDAAGTSVGNFYQYFENKEQVFEALINEFHKVQIEKLRELNQHEIPPIPIIKKVFKELLKLFKEWEGVTIIYIEEMGGISKEYQEFRSNIQDQYYAELEKTFSRGFKLLNITDIDPHIAAIGSVTTFLQAFYWWAKTGFKMDIDEFTTSVVNFFLYGVLTRNRGFPTL